MFIHEYGHNITLCPNVNVQSTTKASSCLTIKKANPTHRSCRMLGAAARVRGRVSWCPSWSPCPGRGRSRGAATLARRGGSGSRSTLYTLKSIQRRKKYLLTKCSYWNLKLSNATTARALLYLRDGAWGGARLARSPRAAA